LFLLLASQVAFIAARASTLCMRPKSQEDGLPQGCGRFFGLGSGELGAGRLDAGSGSAPATVASPTVPVLPTMPELPPVPASPSVLVLPTASTATSAPPSPPIGVGWEGWLPPLGLPSTDHAAMELQETHPYFFACEAAHPPVPSLSTTVNSTLW